MAETPVKVVVDCSAPDKETVAEVTASQILAVFDLERAGTITAEQADAKIAELRQAQKETEAAPDRVTVVPLEDDELADLETARAASALIEQKAATVEANRAAAAAELEAALPQLREVSAEGAVKDPEAVMHLAAATVNLIRLVLQLLEDDDG